MTPVAARGRRAAALCALVALCGARAPAPDVAGAQHVEVRLATARFRVEPETAAARCDALTPDDLVVRFRGRRLGPEAIVSLERSRRPTLHALLIDTSRSMAGRLAAARAAAAAYLRRLDPERDRAFVLTADDDVRLRHAPTSDLDALLAAVDAIRVGQLTALRDGVDAAIGELALYPDRPVLVLVTDGADSASAIDASLLARRLERLPDLTTFAIGIGLPPIHGGGPGAVTPKKWLQRLAGEGGASFDVSTDSGLDESFAEIRRKLDREWELAVSDAPGAEGAARFGVRLRRTGCRVEGVVAWQPRPPAALDEAESVNEIELPASEVWHLPIARADVAPDGEARRDGRTILGNVVDLTLEPGPLYSVDRVEREWFNEEPGVARRPFAIRLEPVESLPREPAGLAQRLAEAVEADLDRPFTAGARQRPAERHARPYDDLRAIWHGRTWLHHREALAALMAGLPDYRAWADRRLDEEARRALALRFPGESSERAGARDRFRYLAAWLGDVPAAELLGDWERAESNRLLGGGVTTEGAETFVRRYESLSRLLGRPSYARVLTPLIPGRDPDRDAIGFWRVVLPRPGWMLLRVQDRRKHPEYGRIPFDLVPPTPAAFRWLASLAGRDEPLVRELRGHGWTVAAIEYATRARPRDRQPDRAFDEASVRLLLAPVGAAAGDGALVLLETDLGEDGPACEGRVVFEPPVTPVPPSLASALNDLARRFSGPCRPPRP